MAESETPLTDQMSALLTYANGITGASDTRLGDAVKTLGDGYGGGGGVSVQTGTIIFDSTVRISSDGTHVDLGLSKKARLIYLWITPENWNKIGSYANNYLCSYFITDFFTYYSAYSLVRSGASSIVTVPEDCKVFDGASYYVNTCTGAECGYAPTGNVGCQYRYSNFSGLSLDDDGFTITRLGTAGQNFYATTYNWIAIFD